MTEVTFEQQPDARIGFGEGTVNTPISAKPAALHHKPSSQTQLICRWHRSAQGPLACTWTEVPSTPLGARDVQLPDLGSGFGTGHVRPYVRQLGLADVPAIEEHLLKLAPLDRRARFLSHTADEVISDYVRRLDPFRAVLIGAFDLSERVVGLVEAHPIVGTRKAEAAITVDVAFRRCGLGRQLVARALGLAFALGVQSVEFNFLPSNRALVCLVQSLGGRIVPTLNYASIDRTANWISSAKAA